jgi:cell division protein FtsB
MSRPKRIDGVFAQAFEPPAQEGLSHLDALKGLLDDLENDLDAALDALDKENDAIGAEIQRMMEELAAANEAASQALDRLHPEGDDEDDDGDGDRDAWIKKV